MTPTELLFAITDTREPQTSSQRLRDVKNIGEGSAIEAAAQAARWLTIVGIANSLLDTRLRAAALDMLQTQPVRDVERFLWGLGK